jgi:P4 family phage/plasmid primase-like protien
MSLTTPSSKITKRIKGSSSNMLKETEYKNYQDFIRKHYVDKDDKTTYITNTRIGNPGGKYHISEDEYNTFLELYYRDIVSKGADEYLTEKQLVEGGPIAIDVDLRYPYETSEKQYKKTHIDDLVYIYLEELKKIFRFDDKAKFPIYIFEKSNVNRLEDKQLTKDGIHIVIGIQSDRITQTILRKRIIEEIAQNELWISVPIINTWEDVFDEGISKGHTNWQLYGSRKPQHEPYRLTHYYEIEYDGDDGEMICTDLNIKKFDMETDFKKLSIRYKDHLAAIFTTEFYDIHQNIESTGLKKQASKNNLILDGLPKQQNVTINVLQIRNHTELEIAVQQFLESIPNSEYELREAYEYTMILPESYYGDGSFNKWIRVGWALCNISYKLFIVWLSFSAKSKTFLFSSIHELLDKWKGFETNIGNGLTIRSIMYWCREEVPEDYNKVRSNSMDYHIENTLKCTYNNYSNDTSISKLQKSIGSGDSDIAFILKQLYKDEYICASVKHDKWFRFAKHRWVEDECGTSLRRHISEELRGLYRNKHDEIVKPLYVKGGTKDDEAKTKQVEKQSAKIMEIILKLSRTSDKDHILKEARELFFDRDIKFLDLLDSNPYLMCFKNGVWDFNEKKFRAGRAEDYISKCTNIDYRKIDKVRDAKIIGEIEDFMEKLFPIEPLRKYMWEHLASCLIGVNLNQTFHMYIGGGENGKSVLTDLMSQILGDYKSDAPLCLITQARIKQGQASPDIVALKGIRYAVMQEPSKGDRINEGALKELTSGTEPIRGRNLFSAPITFVPQFKLIVCTNELLEVKTRDHATWRRFRIADFVSLFTDNPVKDDIEKPHQFKIDRKLKERFPQWREVFISMLVDIVLRTDGHITDCQMVMESTNKYREREDHIAEFIRDKIIVDPSGKITKTEATNEFKLWYESNYGRGGPTTKEVHEYFDKKFGKFKSGNINAWLGAKIRMDRDIVIDPNEFEFEDD